ncbi:MAG: DMT family transporter [Bacteroidota bacterium]
MTARDPEAAPDAAIPTADANASVPRHVWGALFVGLVSISSAGVLIRFASDAEGLTVALWRTMWAVALLLPVVPRARADWHVFTRRDWLLVGAAGVFLGLHFILWITSLYHTSVASATVLVTMSPLFIAVLGIVALGERPALRTWIAILVGLVGAVLIGAGDAGAGVFPRAWLGNGLALSAAAMFAVYIVIGRAVRQRVSFLAYLFPLNVVAMLTALTGALVTSAPLGAPLNVIGWTFVMALFPQILGHGSFNYAVRYISAAMLGLLTLTEPAIASLLAYVFFQEVPGALAFAGMVVVLVSLAVVIVRRSPREQAEAAD